MSTGNLKFNSKTNMPTNIKQCYCCDEDIDNSLRHLAITINENAWCVPCFEQIFFKMSELINSTSKSCTCSIDTLLKQGCQCGG